MNNDTDQLVYSTERAVMLPENSTTLLPKGDGVVRVQYQRSGRKGKGVCVIKGLDLDMTQMNELATMLKKKCGCGGTVKESVIEIQGDKRELIKFLLEERKMRVIFSGG